MSTKTKGKHVKQSFLMIPMHIQRIVFGTAVGMTKDGLEPPTDAGRPVSHSWVRPSVFTFYCFWIPLKEDDATLLRRQRRCRCVWLRRALKLLSPCDFALAVARWLIAKKHSCMLNEHSLANDLTRLFENCGIHGNGKSRKFHLVWPICKCTSRQIFITKLFE